MHGGRDRKVSCTHRPPGAGARTRVGSCTSSVCPSPSRPFAPLRATSRRHRHERGSRKLSPSERVQLTARVEKRRVGRAACHDDHARHRSRSRNERPAARQRADVLRSAPDLKMTPMSPAGAGGTPQARPTDLAISVVADGIHQPAPRAGECVRGSGVQRRDLIGAVALQLRRQRQSSQSLSAVHRRNAPAHDQLRAGGSASAAGAARRRQLGSGRAKHDARPIARTSNAKSAAAVDPFTGGRGRVPASG